MCFLTLSPRAVDELCLSLSRLLCSYALLDDYFLTTTTIITVTISIVIIITTFIP